jgi:hypothetical protein
MNDSGSREDGEATDLAEPTRQRLACGHDSVGSKEGREGEGQEGVSGPPELDGDRLAEEEWDGAEHRRNRHREERSAIASAHATCRDVPDGQSEDRRVGGDENWKRQHEDGAEQQARRDSERI